MKPDAKILVFCFTSRFHKFGISLMINSQVTFQNRLSKLHFCIVNLPCYRLQKNYTFLVFFNASKNVFLGCVTLNVITLVFSCWWGRMWKSWHHTCLNILWAVAAPVHLVWQVSKCLLEPLRSLHYPAAVAADKAIVKWKLSILTGRMHPYLNGWHECASASYQARRGGLRNAFTPKWALANLVSDHYFNYHNV